MNRIFKIQSLVLAEIEKYDTIVNARSYPIDWEKIHMISCGKIGLLLAASRGIDPELTSIACSLHDFGRIISGKQEGHAEVGYQPLQIFLRKTDLFSTEEIAIISNASKNHSQKSITGTPLEEVVKDADVLDFDQYGLPPTRREQQERLDKIQNTLYASAIL